MPNHILQNGDYALRNNSRILIHYSLLQIGWISCSTM